MRVLDLFAGLRGWSEPWRGRGHDIFTVDLDPSFDVDLHADVAELKPADLPWKPDVVLASPPCESFSVLTIGRNWQKRGNRIVEHVPKTEAAIAALALVRKTVELLEALDPCVLRRREPRRETPQAPIRPRALRATDRHLLLVR